MKQVLQIEIPFTRVCDLVDLENALKTLRRLSNGSSKAAVVRGKLDAMSNKEIRELVFAAYVIVEALNMPIFNGKIVQSEVVDL